MDNSGGAQVWVEGDRWGPLDGQLLHLSYGQCRLLMALIEEVDGVFQGGTIKFPTVPTDFESGIMRGRFNPRDGQLYVSGLRGWQTRAIRDGCFQRIRYTGGAVHLPTAVKTFRNGIRLTFSEPLDRALAENADNYFVEQWNYLWSKEYGSPEFKVDNPQEQGRDEVPVVSATLMDDDRSVFLEMPGRHPVNQLSISWLLSAAAGDDDGGQRFRGTYAHTINANPTDSFPESNIVRRSRPRRISKEVEGRLERGLEYRFQSAETGQVDVRRSRLVALRQPTADSPTPFLPPGAFSLEVSGTLRTPLSGFYDFKIESSGPARLWLNDQLVIDDRESNETSLSILLPKGHNPIRISFQSLKQGTAKLRLLWRGYDFDWEPVPPHVFFHDAGSAELLHSGQLRNGRELFADFHCAACHQTDVGSAGMFEMTLAAPELSAAGKRFGRQWLQQWLITPRSLRSEAHMPAMLGDGDQAKQEAADIAAFLLADQTAAEQVERAAPSGAELIDNGSVLYEQLGCIACHHFDRASAGADDQRLSLHYANSKFPPGALANFLRKPSAHYSSTRMPDFRLTAAEAAALAALVRSESKGTLNETFPAGNAARGEKLFSEKGCRQCHSLGKEMRVDPAQLVWNRSREATRGCLADSAPASVGVPAYSLSDDERRSLRAFLVQGLDSLGASVAVETSERLFRKLRCASCHDRDGRRADRALLIAEEGSGSAAEQLPQLTLAGEKLQPGWTRSLLAGELSYKSRPWLVARMPAFAAYAEPLAGGLACEHGIDPHEQTSQSFDRELASVGEQLTLQTGLDCRQCHAIGSQQPRGDKETKIALGVNFSYIRDRMRRDAYHRFMFDPPRYDINTKMIRLSENGLTTKLKTFFDADAKQQFGAVWHYMQSLPDASELKAAQAR
jgi:cytochrome c551/c552